MDFRGFDGELGNWLDLTIDCVEGKLGWNPGGIVTSQVVIPRTDKYPLGR